MASIQGVYLALFGRPADPAGLAYWTEQSKNGTDLSKIIDTMTKLPEATARFAGLTDAALITSIYQALFDRLPDAAGLAFFTAQLQSGKQTIGSIAINILDGAQGTDLTLIQNREKAANVFTATLDTPAEISAYSGTSAADFGRTFIKGVSVDPATVPTATQAQSAVNTGLPGASGGQAPGGGTGDGGGGVVTPPAPQFQKSYGDLAATFAPNELYAGKGNPTNGFTKAVNTAAGIELGLDVRQYKNPAEIAPDQTNGNVWTVKPGDQEITRFAYSASSQTGLDKYNFELMVDTDGTANTSFLTFQLAKDQSVEAHAYNNSDSQYDWILQNATGSIQDDGGNAAGTVTQNVQSLQWYTSPEGRFAGDEHTIRLVAKDKTTNQIVAETDAVIKFAGSTQRVSEDFVGNRDMVVDDANYGTVELTAQGTAIFKDSTAGKTGPFTRFDKYRTDTPDVVTTTVDIKIDSSHIGTGEGFDYSVAANNKAGTHMRDFIFHVANDGGKIVVSANNNTSFDPSVSTPNKTLADGWYTFKHTMYKNSSGDLEVKMQVFSQANKATAVFEQILTQTTDDYTNFGGNRYGWFTNIDVNEGVEVDNWALAAQYSTLI